MRKADLLFVVNIIVMSCVLVYALWTKNLVLFAIAEAGCLIDIIAFARYNRK